MEGLLVGVGVVRVGLFGGEDEEVVGVFDR